jgi:hypothetical protein
MTNGIATDVVDRLRDELADMLPDRLNRHQSAPSTLMYVVKQVRRFQGVLGNT